MLAPPSPLLLSSDSILRRFFALLLALPCALKSLLLTQRGLGGAGKTTCFSSSEVDEEADTRLDEVDDVPLRLLELLLWAVCLAILADHRHSVHLRLPTGTAADTWAVELCAGRDSTDTSPALPHSIGRIRLHPSNPQTRWTPGGNVVVGLLLLVTMVVYDDSA